MRSFRLFAILILCCCAAASRADVLHELLAGRVFPRRVSWSAANEMLAFTDEHQIPTTVGFYDPATGFVQTFPLPCTGCNDGVTARAYIEDIFAVNGGAWLAWTRVGMDGSPLDGGMNSYLSFVDLGGAFTDHPVERQDAFRRYQFGSIGHSFIVPSLDGNEIWFTENAIGHIGSFNVKTGAMRDFPLSSAISEPSGIAVAPNGNVYAALAGSGKLAEISLAGVLKEYTLPKAGNNTAVPFDVAVGLDGTVLITDVRGRLASFRNGTFVTGNLGSDCVPGELEAGGSGEYYVGCSSTSGGTIGHITVDNRTLLQFHFGPIPFELAKPAYPYDLAWNKGSLLASAFEVDADAAIDHLFGGDAPARCDLEAYFQNHGKRITSMFMTTGNSVMATLGYGVDVVARGGTEPYTITLESDLPAGLDFAFNRVSGYPEVAGRFNLLFRVTDHSTPACEAVIELPLEIVVSRMRTRAAPH